MPPWNASVERLLTRSGNSLCFPTVIKSFADRETEKIRNLQQSKRLPIDIQQRVLNKLAMIRQATVLEDLRIPPANRLASLKGNRIGLQQEYDLRKARAESGKDIESQISPLAI